MAARIDPSLTPEQRAERRREMCRVYGRTHYEKHRAEVIAKNVESNKKLREKLRGIVIAAKSVPCADCGVRYPPYVMQFDHIGEEKNFNVASGVAYASISRIEHEISLCEVVCANCHAERSHARGQLGKRRVKDLTKL